MEEFNRALSDDEIAALANTPMDGIGARANDPDPEIETQDAALKLAADLQAYHRAFEQEFASIEPDSPESTAAARRKVFELIPDAGSTMRHLLLHADSEGVRAGIAKFVFTEALRTARTDEGEDALASLVKSLQAND